LARRELSTGARCAVELLEQRIQLSTTPSAATQLLGTGISASQINLTWVETSTVNLTGFTVERSVDGVNFTAIATNLPASTTSYSDTSGLAPQTQYTYEVVSLGSSGNAVSQPTIANTLSTVVDTGQPVSPTAGFNFNASANTVTPTASQRNNIYYVGQSVSFTLTPSANQTLVGTTYQVRDYYGNLVDSGAASATTLTVNVSQPGWYKLYLYGSTSSSAYGTSVGGTTFTILNSSPNFPVVPAPGVDVASGGSVNDEAVRDVTGLGPQRYAVPDASDPQSALALIEPDIAIDNQLYLSNTDSQRPRSELIAFPNGVPGNFDYSGISTIVAALHAEFPGDQFYYEANNEPDLAGESPAQFVSDLKTFRSTILAAAIAANSGLSGDSPRQSGPR